MKQSRKQTKIIATLCSLVFALALAFAFTAKADAATAGYKQVDKFTAGKDYVIAIQDGDTWKAVTAPSTIPSGSNPVIEVTGTAVTVETELETAVVTDPAAAQIWAASSASQNNGQNSITATRLENNGNPLYFCSDGFKAQDGGYRPIIVEDGKYLYIDTSYDQNAGSTNTFMYMAYNAGTFTTSKNTSQATAKAGAVAVTLFEKMTSEEFEQYEQDKADKAAADALAQAKADAINEIKAIGCDPAVETDYINQVNAAKTPAEVDAILEAFRADPNAKPSGSGSEGDKDKDKDKDKDQGKDQGSATSDVDKEKETATADVNKAIAADNLNKYDADEQKAVKDLVAQYIIKINAATSVNDVKNLVNAFNAAIKGIPTKADKAAIAKIQVKIKKIKVGKKKMTVKWKPNKAKFDGYELSYVPKPKKKAKKVTVKKATASKKVIKKLKKGKKYKVKIRGYKLFGTTKVYGKWSKVKTSKKIK
jgi:hypothetical protein